MAFTDRLHNRGSISTGYNIDNSVKLEADNGEKFISSQFGSAGNQKTWTISFWVKITELGAYQMYWGCFDTYHYKGTDDKMYVNFRGGSENFFLGTNRVFRDTSAWYHFVVVCDATNGTAADRGRFYVNGVRETDYQLTTYQNMDSNDNTFWNGSNVHSVGGQNGSSTFDVSGYMAEFHSVDGQALDPTDFGEFDEDSGIWKPIDYTGTYGTNGFYLDFENSSDLGDDVSGNSKAFTNTNITSADQATDTPTNNFAIGNANVYFSNPTFNTFNPLTEGATKLTKGANGWETLSSTIAVTSGKWYMEMQNISVPEAAMMSVFPTDIGFIFLGGQINNYAGKVSGDGGISYYSYNGNIYYNASNTSYGVSWANETNTMAIALDMDNGKVYFARANVWQNSGDPTSGATGTGAIDLIQPNKPHMMGYALYSNNTNGAVNFGGYTPSSISSEASDANGYGTFEYAPPTGYYALCTKNLAEYG